MIKLIKFGTHDRYSMYIRADQIESVDRDPNRCATGGNGTIIRTFSGDVKSTPDTTEQVYEKWKQSL